MRCTAKTVIFVAVAVALVVPLALTAHQHASARFLQYRDNPAGRTIAAVSPSRVLYAPDPAYTKAAYEAKVKGAVVLDGTLGVDGCLRDVKVVRALGYGLDESAVYAVERWKFNPFRKGGVPSVAKLRVEVNFDPTWSPLKADLPSKTCGQESDVPDSLR